MASGSRRIRVACKICDYDKIRTLRAGDDRTLEQLRQSARCGKCRAWASKGLVRIEPVEERAEPAAPRTRVRDPDRLFIDSFPGKDVEAPVIYGRSDLTYVAPPRPRPMPRMDPLDAVHAVMAQACAILPFSAFILLYATAATLSAFLVVGFFRAADFEQRTSPRGDFQCEAKMHYMEINGPEPAYARERAYDQLAAHCRDIGYRVADMRYRERSARSGGD